MNKRIKLILFAKLLLLSTLVLSVFDGDAQSVTLNYPKNGFVTSSNSVEICWNVEPGFIYEVEVATNNNFTNLFYSVNNTSSRKLLVTNLSINTTYYWRVRASSPSLTAWSSISSFQFFKPSLINNLALWVKADTLTVLNNNTVLTWGDLSNNQYNFTQATAANQPTLIQNFCNNKAALKFDGNDAYEIPSFNYAPNNTVFLVGKRNGGQTGGRYLGCYGNNLEISAEITLVSGNVLGNYNSSNPSLFTVVRSTSPSSFLLNDSLIGSTNAPIAPLSAGGLYLGRSFSNSPLGYLTGEIAEIIVIATQLNDSLISLTNRYLMDKYSNILYLGNDTVINDNFCPLSLSSNIGFTDFLWSTGDTTSSISVNTTGTYWLRARDYFGRFTYDTIKVTFPNVNQLSSQPICVGGQVVWNTGLSSPYTHLWSTGNTQNQITISSAGQFYFTASDSYGCNFYSDTTIISIDNFSNENTLGNDTSLCSGNTMQLQNNNSLNLNYLWSTGSNNDSIVINSAGSYWVEVSNSNNCIFRDTINISIIGIAPQALFSASNGCIGAAINFTDLSVPPLGESISNWQWNFNDGTFSNTQNNQHSYDSAGVYTVSLKVTLQSGCGAIYNQNIEVFKAPSVNFTSFNLCNNQATQFNNSSNLYGGSLQSLNWNFGDAGSANNTANTSTAYHNYFLPGNYTVQFILNTNEGCSDTAQATVNIKPSPIANFTSENYCLGDSTVFVDISEIAFPWQNLSRKWLFPNGDSSIFYQANFVFDAPGTFPVHLMVQASNGCRDSIVKQVSIFNKPFANFIYQKNCIGAPTLFSDSSICINCNIINYNWFIDNNSVGSTSNINYLFSDTGNYLVNLIIENNAGCSSSTDTIIEVNLPPTANFSMNSNFGSPPFIPIFENTSSNANSFLWQFGDGNSSLEFNPEHTYIDTGLFNISLTAFNSDNCSSSFTQQLKLQAKKIDLVLYDLSTILKDDYIETDIVVFNKSTTIVSGFETSIANSSNIATKESQNLFLLPGEIKPIKLKTKIKQGEGYNFSEVICVEITNINEGDDTDKSNNSLCKALSDAEFKLLSVFPNPSVAGSFLEFISPSKDELFIEIIDAIGNRMYTISYTAQLGYNKLALPTNTLAAGIYSCKVLYKGTSQTLQFIKSNNN